MSENYKVLGQVLTGSLAGNGTTIKESVAYTVPANTQASISAIEITNSDSTSKNYTLSFVKAEEVATSSSTVTWNTTEIQNINRFVGMGYYGDPTYSDDGINWVKGSNLGMFDGWSNGPIYGNGKIVVSSSRGVIAYSEDGITWSIGTQLFPELLNQWSIFTSQMAFGNGKFVAVSRFGDYAWSTDGANWTRGSGTIHSSSYNSFFTGVKFLNNWFVAVDSYGGAGFSRDGIVWRWFPHSYYAASSKMVYAFGKYHSVSSDGYLFRISDFGVENMVQSEYMSPVANLGFNTWKADIHNVNGKLFITTGQGHIYISNDGITWQFLWQPWVAGLWNEPVYHGGNYIFSFYNHVVWANDLEINQVFHYSFINIDYISSVMYKNGKYIVVNDYGHLAYSTDLYTWTLLYTDTVNQYMYAQHNTPQAFNFNRSIVVSNAENIPTSLNKQKAVYNKVIASGESHEIKGGVTLSAGDQIRIYSQSNAIIANIYGVEIA